MAKSETASKLDKETQAALLLFNEYVSADRERTARNKRIKQAERAKDAAAAEITRLSNTGSTQEKTEAESAYREAIKTWRELRRQSSPQRPS